MEQLPFADQVTLYKETVDALQAEKLTREQAVAMWQVIFSDSLRDSTAEYVRLLVIENYIAARTGLDEALRKMQHKRQGTARHNALNNAERRTP